MYVCPRATREKMHMYILYQEDTMQFSKKTKEDTMHFSKKEEDTMHIYQQKKKTKKLKNGKTKNLLHGMIVFCTNQFQSVLFSMTKFFFATMQSTF